MARRRALARRTGVASALLYLGCLPLDDLSSYSSEQQPLTDAGLAGPAVSHAAPEPDARPPRTPTLSRPRPPSTDARAPGGGAAPSEPEDPPASGSETPTPGGADAGAETSSPIAGCITLGDTADVEPGSCYAISAERRPWAEALLVCQRWGGSLVSINSASEADLLDAAVSVAIWIGANDREREGTLRWANADPFEFERFAAGEPNNALGIQDCVERRADSSWGDRVCSVQNVFVCERPFVP